MNPIIMLAFQHSIHRLDKVVVNIHLGWKKIILLHRLTHSIAVHGCDQVTKIECLRRCHQWMKGAAQWKKTVELEVLLSFVSALKRFTSLLLIYLRMKAFWVNKSFWTIFRLLDSQRPSNLSRSFARIIHKTQKTKRGTIFPAQSNKQLN